jgi:hypothetical protein
VRREDLRQYAVSAYQSGNDSPEFDALISNDASAGVQKRSYLQSLSGSRQDLVDALNAARQKAEEDGVRLKAAEDVSTAKAAEIEQLKKAADEATNQQAAINARVQGELRVLVQAENARIAAAAAAAKYWKDRGGFKTTILGTSKVGQVHFIWKGSRDLLKKLFPIQFTKTNQIFPNSLQNFTLFIFIFLTSTEKKKWECNTLFID